ncbi:uncharacterized protein [Dermacentor andersoni]|uniref:uncharacterized protein n=1 Tax=Dermacentor andersoni TaxID=34620 RepID=UPI002155D999|nr:uncharacterized protein LOC126533810 [Dermacentor andersoni]
MFPSALLVLLGSAFVAPQMIDFFEGCVPMGQEQDPGGCVLAPESWLSMSTFRRYAQLALANAHIQPDEGHLNTLLELTRIATERTDGFTIILEFTTVKSTCDSSVAYSEDQCRPLYSKANGLCQAVIRNRDVMRFEDAWCVPLFED